MFSEIFKGELILCRHDGPIYSLPMPTSKFTTPKNTKYTE